MSVGWDFKWCPVSRVTAPLARKSGQRVDSKGPPEKLKHFKTGLIYKYRIKHCSTTGLLELKALINQSIEGKGNPRNPRTLIPTNNEDSTVYIQWASFLFSHFFIG